MDLFVPKDRFEHFKTKFFIKSRLRNRKQLQTCTNHNG